MQKSPPTLSDLVSLADSGDKDALRGLFDATYDDLRALARIRLQVQRGKLLLDTTALVHESFLRFAGAGQLHIHDRQHFMCFASKVMRAVVVDHVRECVAARRGGGAVHITLTTQLGNPEVDGAAEILRVHEALEELATLDERMSKVVEMRYFAGESGADDGLALSARFNSPTAVAADAAGNLYIADSGNFTIRKLTPSGEVTTIAGRVGLEGFTPGDVGVLSSVRGLTLGSDGALYATMYQGVARIELP